MPVFADQTIYSGIIALIAVTSVFAGIAVAIVQDYRTQRSKHRSHSGLH